MGSHGGHDIIKSNYIYKKQEDNIDNKILSGTYVCKKLLLAISIWIIEYLKNG